LNPTIKLLLFDGAITWNNQATLAESLGLNPGGIDSHVSYQPLFHCLGPPLAEVHIILLAPKRIGVSFDPENRLRVSLDKLSKLLQAGSGARAKIRGIIVKQQIGWHQDRGRSVADLPRAGKQFIQVTESSRNSGVTRRGIGCVFIVGLTG